MKRINPNAAQDFAQSVLASGEYVTRNAFEQMKESYQKEIDWLRAELEDSRTKEGTYLNILRKIKLQQESNNKLFRLFVKD